MKGDLRELESIAQIFFPGDCLHDSNRFESGKFAHC